MFEPPKLYPRNRPRWPTVTYIYWQKFIQSIQCRISRSSLENSEN